MLVFDLGSYLGQYTKYYLNKGYKVISVECNPEYYKYLIKEFGNRSTILNKCIYSESGINIPFYISNHDDWSSVYLEVANRDNELKNIVEVNTITLVDLISIYGTPDYCKIDIENCDWMALNSLFKLHGNNRPKFISCESECFGSEISESDDSYRIINLLKDLDYKKFKLSYQPQLLDFMEITDWDSYESIVSAISKDKSYKMLNNYDYWVDIYATK